MTTARQRFGKHFPLQRINTEKQNNRAIVRQGDLCSVRLEVIKGNSFVSSLITRVEAGRMPPP
jgi:hypothetical protein